MSRLSVVEQAELNAAGRLWDVASVKLGDAQDTAEFNYRPSTRYKPKLYRDGNAWCALFGQDIQSGVSAFGDTPDEAMREFDKEWFKSVSAISNPDPADSGEPTTNRISS